MVGIEGNPSTAYHPQTDGQTEWINQEIEQYLRIFIDHHKSNWSEWLSLAEFSYNNKVQTSLGHSPFFVNHGYHPHDGVSPRRTARNIAVDSFVTAMDRVKDEAKAALTKARDLMKRYYDRRRGRAMEYKAGDLIWLEKMNIGSTRPMKKLDDRRAGPFPVIERVGAAAYRIRLPGQHRRRHPVFNQDLLLPFKPSVYPQQHSPPPPDPTLIDHEEEWEVDFIKDSRWTNHLRHSVQYLVHWKGFNNDEDTWEPARNLVHTSDAIADFHQEYPHKPHIL